MIGRLITVVKLLLWHLELGSVDTTRELAIAVEFPYAV